MEYLKDFLSTINLSTLSIVSISITDIIDILIIAYFIYKIMLWIKQTRAWSLFKGVVVVLAISALSYVFHLYTISWIVNNTFNVGLIAVIVLFQPEMRKALEQIGKGTLSVPFLSSGEDEKSAKISAQIVEEIIEAAKMMAEARTGALIVIENDYVLTDLEQTGIPIDAIVTRQLLINIFNDKTPLHDGAVIVRSNRIVAACCILPLTQDEIGRELGTRHRAAVGASEETDAFVLVVSEETGQISMAMGGKLHRELSESDIRGMLQKEERDDKKKIVLWRAKRNDGEAK